MNVKNLPIYLALTLSLILLITARITHDADEYPSSEALGITEGERNYTSIIISGKTLVIKAAQGYTPTITSDRNKPLIILERDPAQKSTTQFDQVIVVNDEG